VLYIQGEITMTSSEVSSNDIDTPSSFKLDTNFLRDILK
jgi:hypothetical protein